MLCNLFLMMNRFIRKYSGNFFIASPFRNRYGSGQDKIGIIIIYHIFIKCFCIVHKTFFLQTLRNCIRRISYFYGKFLLYHIGSIL